MKKTYKTKGICASHIEFEIDGDDCVRNVVFNGGCMGNRVGIGKLVEGMKRAEAIEKLRGIPCRNGTSCPDQLAQALSECEVCGN